MHVLRTEEKEKFQLKLFYDLDARLSYLPPNGIII